MNDNRPMLRKIYGCSIEFLFIILIIIAYILPWISWGKLIVSGFDLPFFYKKMTNISNTILFFSKKEFVYTAFYLYSVPMLAVLFGWFSFKKKYVTSLILLFLVSLNALFISLYMYFYLINSSVLKFKNGSLGLHLLTITSLFGLYYTLFKLRQKFANVAKQE